MRILVVDDNAPVRKSLRQLINLRADFEVVGEGTNGEEAVKAVDELGPDIVLMDMNMPIMDGVEATKVIKERHPQVQVLALTALADDALVASMVRAGASGYLLKGGSSAELMDSLRAVAQGKGALDREITRSVIENMADLYRDNHARAGALAELDRMKSEFVSIVSHELRTPVTSIKGGVETLRNSWRDVDEELKLELLDSMALQCERLSRLIGQIVTVSGIQRGGLGLKPHNFSLGNLAQDAVETFGGAFDGRAVRLDIRQAHATGDEARIREVAVGFIQNALDFSFGTIAIKAATRDDRPFLSVSDEGPGVDAAELEALIQSPFNQLDSSTTRRVGGLGLSLYIARQVLEASGGRLEIDTDPSRGSTFTMVLPPAR